MGHLYVADVGNGTIWRVAGGEGAEVVTTVICVAGSQGLALGAIPGTARLNQPYG